MTKSLASYPFLNVLLHTGPTLVPETQWLGFAGSADFRTALQETPRLARAHKAAGWVADDRRLGAGRPKDLEWTHHEVLHPLDDLGCAASPISGLKRRSTNSPSTACIGRPCQTWRMRSGISPT